MHESKRIRDCTDGTSNTVIIAEQSGSTNNVENSNNPLGGWHGSANFTSTNWNAGSTLPLAAGGSWYMAGLSSLRYAPNAYFQSGAPVPAASEYSANTVLNSFHTGGIHVLLTDGSVRFVSDNVDMNTLRQLCVCDDGNVIGEF
jgi:hypothetical protein